VKPGLEVCARRVIRGLDLRHARVTLYPILARLEREGWIEGCREDIDPSVDDLAGRDALAVLAAAPTPAAGLGLGEEAIIDLLRQAGRRRYLSVTAEKIHHALAPSISRYDRKSRTPMARRLVSIITELGHQIDAVQAQVVTHFGRHPDGEIYLSQPGLGHILSARVLAEFGDARGRYADGKARRNYAGTSPIARASGKKKVVLARYARNNRLTDALFQQAFAALTGSPGARAFYDSLRARDIGHNDALRRLSNRLVGILHGCLRHHTTYDEATAWPSQHDQHQAA
jgi:transposase